MRHAGGVRRGDKMLVAPTQRARTVARSASTAGALSTLRGHTVDAGLAWQVLAQLAGYEALPAALWVCDTPDSLQAGGEQLHRQLVSRLQVEHGDEAFHLRGGKRGERRQRNVCTS